MKDPKLFRLLRNAVFFLTGLLVLIVVPLYAYKVSQKTDYTDFLVYYRAALRAQALDWTNIYTTADGPSPFRYMPPFLALLRPFAFFDKLTAGLIWYFLQLSAFAGGFYFLYLTLKATAFTRRRLDHFKQAALVSSLSFLFVLRLCLDTLTIGQVSSFMFLGFALGLWGYVRRAPATSAFGLALPALLKMGPGIVYGVFLSPRNREKWKALRAALSTLVGFLLLGEIWGYLATGSFKIYHSLWLGWAQIVAADSEYYDSSHYGSQSLNSTLLRAAKAGWISGETAGTVHLWTALLVCAAIVVFWVLRSPKSTLGRGLFFSLGLFPYFWLMPETFKYSLTPLSFPVAFLIAGLFENSTRNQELAQAADVLPACRRRNRLTWVALLFGAATITLAGKDIVGDTLFFGSQHASLPFLATLLLGLATLKEAWFQSHVSARGRFLWKGLLFRSSLLGPWNRMPAVERPLALSVLMPLPLSNSCSLLPENVERTLLELETSLSAASATSGEFEILLIPYGNRLSEFHPVLKRLCFLTEKAGSHFRILKPTSLTSSANQGSNISGRGAALREGFLSSHGRRFLIGHIEQPCGVAFFEEALRLLDQGYDLVRANRRLPESHFEIPVRLLPLVYSRHRLGLWFNRLVRAVLPIQTTDTHSGNYALSWKLASQAFATQVSTHFLFDLELSLTARAQNLREQDLAVEVQMETEKTRSRMFFETLTILRGLWILARRYRQGCYSAITVPRGITADDWGLSPGVNHGILTLARQGIVQRVSMMANAAHLEEGLSELLALGDRVELGLHFNLTYGKPMQLQRDFSLLQKDGTFIASPLGLLRSWLGLRLGGVQSSRDSKNEFVQRELRVQLQKLIGLGIRIQYLDGHHHIHMVPGILSVLIHTLKEFKISRVRLPLDYRLLLTPQAPVTILAWLARGVFKKYGLESLPFAYPQNRHFLDPGSLRGYLSGLGPSEIIVHPAQYNDLAHLPYADPYTEGRVIEFKALQMLRVL